MKKVLLLILGVGLFTLTGCDSDGTNSSKFDEKSVEEKVDYHIENMTIEEKIAQLLIVYYNGSKFDETLRNSLETNQPGGFIMQGVNITTYEDTLNYVKQIKETSKVPMFVSIDQEGGIVQRLYNLQDIKPTYIPAMYEVGQTNDEELAYEVGELMAKELRTIGVNVTYAPVIDVFTNEENTVIGKRAFGRDAQTVIDMAIPLSKGLSDNMVIPVFKHFPGHGDTYLDSHYDLPIVEKTLEELRKLELSPFKSAIENNALMIMTGHIAYPNITGDNTPATLSYKMITEVLREELGYDGVVISDALNMGALTRNYSNSEIYEMAINAGVDILLMPNSSSAETIRLIKESVKKGNITEDRINQSLRRILTLKYEHLESGIFLGQGYLNIKEHQEVINKIK